MKIESIKKVEELEERFPKTARISTVQTVAKKGAWKDVARTYNIDYMTSNEISKLLDEEADFETNFLNLPSKYQTDEVHKCFDIAEKFEKNPKQMGTHACGVVISPEPLPYHMGLMLSKEGDMATQCDSHDIEDAYGLIKMDFLGLNTLSIMAEILKNIKKNYGIDLKLEDIPEDDEATFDTFCNGRSLTVFQFTTGMMRDMTKQYRPRSIKDLAWLSACVRPGPLDKFSEMLAIKNGEKKPKYICKAAEEIFGPVHGFPVFQENIMSFVIKGCGETEKMADTFRKAMGKSKMEDLKKLEPVFTEGLKKTCKTNGERVPSDDEIKEFWDSLVGFGKYSFNYSHAYAYSVTSYRACYLLTHYPEEYFAAVMNERKDDKDLINSVIRYLREIHIKVQSPDIRYPEAECIPVPIEKKIVYGMSAVKGLGKSAHDLKKLIEENGVPETLGKFLTLAKSYKINSAKIEALIYSGALDCYGKRGTLVANKEHIIDYLQKVGKKTKVAKNQLTLIPEEEIEPDLSNTFDKTDDKAILELLFKERELLGTFITRSPLGTFNGNEYWLDDVKRSLKSRDSWKPVVHSVLGIVLSTRIINTKTGKRMMFADIECEGTILNLTIFPNMFEKMKERRPVKNDIMKLAIRPEGYDEENKTVSACLEAYDYCIK